MLSSDTISVLLIRLRSLSRDGLFGKSLSNVVVSLMKSFVNVGLSSWFICFFSCVVEDSTSSNSSIIRQRSDPRNSNLTNAESSCWLIRKVAPLTPFMYLLFCSLSWSSAMRDKCLLVFKREVSWREFFILVRTTVLQQFHIKPINSRTMCINSIDLKRRTKASCDISLQDVVQDYLHELTACRLATILQNLESSSCKSTFDYAW